MIIAATHGSYILSKVLESAPLQPKSLYKIALPLVNSLTNNEIYTPPTSLAPQNEAYLQYVSMWDVQSMSAVRIWLQIIGTIRDVGKVPLIIFTEWKPFLSIIEKSFPFIKLSNLEIPIVYESGNTTKFRMVGLTEWVQIYGRRRTPYLFCMYILSLVLFGFGMEVATLSALRLEEQEVIRYIKTRTRGGRFLPFSPPETEAVHLNKKQRRN